MTDPATPPTPTPAEVRQADQERAFFSYEGTAVPLSIVLIWLGFLIFGFLYFALHLVL